MERTALLVVRESRRLQINRQAQTRAANLINQPVRRIIKRPDKMAGADRAVVANAVMDKIHRTRRVSKDKVDPVEMGSVVPGKINLAGRQINRLAMRVAKATAFRAVAMDRVKRRMGR
jgi:hypothetical protein